MKRDTIRSGIIRGPDGSLIFDSLDFSVKTTYYSILLQHESNRTATFLDTLNITSQGSQSLITNAPLEIFYYGDDMLIDSTIQFNYFPEIQQDQFDKTTFTYDKSGNLRMKESDCYISTLGFVTNIDRIQLDCTTLYEDYDNENNPMKLIGKKVFPFIPVLSNQIYSSNNFQTNTTQLVGSDRNLSSSSDLTYTYNIWNYPTLTSGLNSNTGASFERTIEYEDQE